MATELATGYVTLLPSAKGFRNALDSELGGDMDAAGMDAGDKAARGFGSRFSSGIKSAAKIAAIGLGAALVGAAAFGKGAVEAASGLAEAQSKVNVVFGDGAEAVNSFAKQAATGIGQSERQALEATGTFGNLMQAFGIGQKPAAEMSTSLVQLASDLASFNNTSVDDALTALQSGLSGEMEPMRRYGASLTDVRLRQKALDLGLISSTKDALSPAAKAQAAYALIMQDTTIAQGDFERTSGGLANQQRILAAEFENSKASIGQALLPLITSVTHFAAENLPKAIAGIQDFVKAIQDGFNSQDVNADGIIGVFQRIGLVAREVVDWFQRNWHTIRDVAMAVFTAIGVAITFFVTKILPAIIKGGQAVTNFFTDHWDEIKDAFMTTFDVLQSAWENVGYPALQAVIETVMAVITAGQGVVNWFQTNWSTIQGVFTTTWAALQAAWTSVGKPIFDSIVQMVTFVADFIRTTWPGISAVVSAVFTTIQTVIETAISAILTIIGGVTTEITTLWDTFGTQILDEARSVWDFIRTVIESTLTVIRGIVQTITSLIHGDFSSAWDGIKQVVQGAMDAIRGFVQLGLDTARNIISGAMSAITGVATSAWETFKSTASSAISNVVSTIGGLPGKAGAALASLGTSIGEKIQSAATTALEAAKTLVSNVVDEVKKLPGRIISALGNVAGAVADAMRGALKTGINSAIDAINAVTSHLGVDIPFINKHVGIPPIPRLHSGGFVPGVPGTEVPAILQAGELVISRADLAAGAVGTGISIGTLVAADPNDTVRQLERLDWQRRMAARSAA